MSLSLKRLRLPYVIACAKEIDPQIYFFILFNLFILEGVKSTPLLLSVETG